MRAITVRQPYARAIAIGRKTVENRGRHAGYRGEIAIHAARTVHRVGDRDSRIIQLFGKDASIGVPLGAIVAVADLVDCHQAYVLHPTDASCCWPWGDQSFNGGSAFHLVLRDVRMLPEPVPCRGALPIGWTVSADVEEQVRPQLAGAVTR